MFIYLAGIFGQSTDPVTWTFDVETNADQSYTFTATAAIDKGWYMYSQHTEEGGPIPLSFTYKEDAELLGNTEELSKAITENSELFGIQVMKFKQEAKFTQIFKSNKGQKEFSGTLRFMSCDNARCLPPKEVPFSVVL